MPAAVHTRTSSLHARNVGYAYAQPSTVTTPHRYAGTSSAFSASANPNEDWTKISDLAERRRIQNRIAQRNYRKKLKKRLEDLERKAASSSTSPEQQPMELARPPRASKSCKTPRQLLTPSSPTEPTTDSTVDTQVHRRASPVLSAVSPHMPQSPYLGQPPHDDRAMFAHSFVRQLSTSPPPFSYSAYPAPEPSPYPTYAAPTHPYHALPVSTAAMSVTTAPYLPPLSAAFSAPTLPTLAPMQQPPIKAEYYAAEDDISPYSINYAMAGIDMPAAAAAAAAAAAYHDAEPAQRHTPALSESYDASVTGSPPAAFPATPDSLRRTPSLHFVS